MTDIQKLKALAEAATRCSGPMRVETDYNGVHQVIGEGSWKILNAWHTPDGKGRDNAEFYAAANPAAVLELIAELEDHALQTRSAREVCVESQGTILTLIAERDQLKAVNFDLHAGQQMMEEEIARLQRFETAYKEFSDKTDWVRPNAAAHEMGMHVADILHKRCNDLTSHNQAQADEIVRLRKDSARYRWLRDSHIGNDPESINLDPASDREGLNAAIDAAMAQEQRP